MAQTPVEPTDPTTWSASKGDIDRLIHTVESLGKKFDKVIELLEKKL